MKYGLDGLIMNKKLKRMEKLIAPIEMKVIEGNIFEVSVSKSNYIKVFVQPWLGNNGRNFGQYLKNRIFYIYISAGGQVGVQAGGQADTNKSG